MHIAKQNKKAQSFALDFVPDENDRELQRAARQRKVSRKRKLTERDHLKPATSTSATVGSSSASASGSSPSSATSTLAADYSKNTRRQRSNSMVDHHTDVLLPPPPPIALSPRAAADLPMPHDLPVDFAFSAPGFVDHPPSDPLQYYPPPFRIQDPLVVDIDRVTKTGIVATGKHRREPVMDTSRLGRRSQHKILFWEYPSWRLIREFDMSFAPDTMSCQITGLQTIRVPHGESETKVRLFSLAVGQPLPIAHQDEADGDDRVDLWQCVLIYRLYNNGATQCVAHLNMDGDLLGREVFFFSHTSWARSSDGELDPNDKTAPLVKPWMEVLSPEDAQYDPRFTVFMLAIGPSLPHVSGCAQLLRFDIRGQRDLLDPSSEPCMWDILNRRFTPLFSPMARSNNTATILQRDYGPPASVVARIHLGRKVSCMIHFRYPPHLNHLICTGSYVRDELTVYDWRFGLKVGVLPWKSRPPPPLPLADPVMEEVVREEPQQHQQQQQQPPQLPQPVQPEGQPASPPPQALDLMEHEDDEVNDMMDEDDFDEDEEEDRSVVQPWGLESTMVLPPYWGDDTRPLDREDFAKRGFRLIAVGDNREDKLEIKVWDISYLLKIDWDPLADGGEHDEETERRDYTSRFFWWKRGTPAMRQLALKMINEREHVTFFLERRGRNRIMRLQSSNERQAQDVLPYSPPKDFQSMILVHTFDKANTDESVMPVKYTAYNVLRTSLFLLTEEGKITVLDIETGQVIGTVNNVAETPDIGPQRQVRGIDVNVVGGNEIVVTSRQGLLRGTLKL
ncbi:hypothetical protein BCR43DRAFT_52419 [Syncephalastrum racemosum]|uniref:Uncharacterized protein n=1 Tax=Syncephalastrum racemosum TaxID=13706 RepID=A0A1X2HVC4_SYNRA|nr:hypothetical protein BCR43DRAFT_52419 [Syncephalastrum racemosum]